MLAKLVTTFGLLSVLSTAHAASSCESLYSFDLRNEAIAHEISLRKAGMKDDLSRVAKSRLELETKYPEYMWSKQLKQTLKRIEDEALQIIKADINTGKGTDLRALEDQLEWALRLAIRNEKFFQEKVTLLGSKTPRLATLVMSNLSIRGIPLDIGIHQIILRDLANNTGHAELKSSFADDFKHLVSDLARAHQDYFKSELEIQGLGLLEKDDHTLTIEELEIKRIYESRFR